MDSSASTQIATMACGTLILLAVLGGIFALAWHGTISGGDAIGIIGTISGVGIGAFGVHAGVKAGASSVAAANGQLVAASRRGTVAVPPVRESPAPQ